MSSLKTKKKCSFGTRHNGHRRNQVGWKIRTRRLSYINHKIPNKMVCTLRPLYRVLRTRKEEQCITLCTMLFKDLDYLNRSNRHHIGKSWLRSLIQKLQTFGQIAPELTNRKRTWKSKKKPERACSKNLMESLCSILIEIDKDEKKHLKKKQPIVDMLQHLKFDRYIFQSEPSRSLCYRGLLQKSSITAEGCWWGSEVRKLLFWRGWCVKQGFAAGSVWILLERRKKIHNGGKSLRAKEWQ